MPTAATISPADQLALVMRQYSDVTERLQRSHDQLKQTVQSLRNDLAEKNRELERRNRLAALGEMAAGMAHEIRNPLGGIQLYASLLAKDLVDQPQSLALVVKIASGVTRLERLVSQVLQFTREISAQRRRTDVAEVIDQAVELARPALNAAAVDCDTDGPRPLAVEVDPHLLNQAALNLLINAAEAIGSRGRGGQVRVRWSAMPSNRLRLSVCDDGPGIPPQALDKICNPFFTTKEMGTGLGLAIVHRIVEAHNGAMTVRNAPEGGAEFELTL